MDQYFGHKPQDWERSMMMGTIDGTGRGEEMQRAMANPDQYTTARPNMTTEASFSVGSMKGAGKGMSKGPETAYYKVQKPTAPAPVQQAAAATPAPAPAEPAEDKGPVEYSPEVTEAKERVNNYKFAMNGNEGSTFEGANSSPDLPSEPEAQGFADKYKLNLLNKGASNSDFTSV